MIRRLHVPVTRPEDVIPHLAKQEGTLACGVFSPGVGRSVGQCRYGLPKRVRADLKTAPEYATAELIDGFFEREVELGAAAATARQTSW